MPNWDSSRTVYLAPVDNLRYNCKFIATNDDYVWKDTPEQKSINAAFYGDKDMAKTIPYEYVENVNWTAVEIISGFQARKRNESDIVKFGDTPFEAVSYLKFDEIYKIDRQMITDSLEIEEQIKDILRYHTGSVHYSVINNYTNNDKLNKQYSDEEIKNLLMDISDKSSIYSTSEGYEWWSIK
jgi:hypothetical protein